MRRSPRDVLTVPVGIVLTAVWVATATDAIVKNSPNAFLIASGPFGAMCAYLFAREFLRRNGGDE